jgi:hypothetical protein
MAGVIVFLLVSLAVSVYFWRLVFNAPARQKHMSARWSPFKLNKEEKEMQDDLSLATALIIAIVAGFLFVSLLILGILGLFRPS